MSDACVRWSLHVVRAMVVFAIATSGVLASVALAPVVPAAAGALPPGVPSGPAPVVPTREVVPVTAAGPTTLNNVTLTKDAVWGPQGSPYVIQGQLTVKTGRALTLLPGTVVKFSGQFARFVVEGQLLSLGSPAQKVTFTSIKDDSVGGDTNGDGSATVPARGDWSGIYIYSEPIGPGGEEVAPMSVLDYSNFAFGGYTSSINCAAGGMVDVSVPNGRAVVSNSNFREALRGGVAVGNWGALHPGDPYRGFVGVYGNSFTNSGCGVSMAEGDIAGNYFGPGLASALFSNFPGDVSFRHNTTNSPVTSANGNGVRYRFNKLTTIVKRPRFPAASL